MLIKPISTEISLSTANTVSDARVVRVFNNTGGTVLITRTSAAAIVIGTCSLQANSVHFIEKNPSDTLTAAAAVLATSIAYTTS
jgi:hypothetical protein